MRTSEIDIVRFFSRSLKDGCSLRFPNSKQKIFITVPLNKTHLLVVQHAKWGQVVAWAHWQ